MSVRRSLITPFIAALMASALAYAGEPPQANLPVAMVKVDAAIPFANHGGVQSWHALSDREIWFEDRSRTWYRAVLFSPAFELPFAEGVGIDARPGGTLDKFGGVTVKGRIYRFASFDQMAGPPPDLARKIAAAKG